MKTKEQEWEDEYFPVIVKEYNKILAKKGSLSAKKRVMLMAMAESLVRKGKLEVMENGEVKLAEK